MRAEINGPLVHLLRHQGTIVIIGDIRGSEHQDEHGRTIERPGLRRLQIPHIDHQISIFDIYVSNIETINSIIDIKTSIIDKAFYTKSNL